MGKLRLRDIKQSVSSGLEVRTWDFKQASTLGTLRVSGSRKSEGIIYPVPIGAGFIYPLHTLPKPNPAQERHIVGSPHPLVTDTKTRTPKRRQEGAPG